MGEDEMLRERSQSVEFPDMAGGVPPPIDTNLGLETADPDGATTLPSLGSPGGVSMATMNTVEATDVFFQVSVKM